MILVEIPLLSETTDQTLDVVLSDSPYKLRILWNELFGYYSLSILELNGNIILENIKMVKDYPLIGRFANKLLPPGDLYFVDSKGRNERPIYESAGTGDYALIYYVPDEVAATAKTSVSTPADFTGSIWDSGLTVFDSGASTWDA